MWAPTPLLAKAEAGHHGSCLVSRARSHTPPQLPHSFCPAVSHAHGRLGTHPPAALHQEAVSGPGLHSDASPASASGSALSPNRSRASSGLNAEARIGWHPGAPCKEKGSEGEGPSPGATRGGGGGAESPWPALATWPALLLAAAQLAGAPLTAELALPPPAAAVLNSPNARIPRTVDAALRRSIPAFNPDVRTVQSSLEDVAFKLRIPQRKPWDQMSAAVTAAAAIISTPDKVMFGVPSGRDAEALQLVSSISEGLRSVQGAIDARDADKLSQRLSGVLQKVAALELLQAPGLAFIIPREYQDLPRLTGRALVELTVERPDGSLSFVMGDGNGPQKKAQLQIVLDGYSAPITAGNFAANVKAGLYNNKPLNVSYASVLAGAGATPGTSGRTVPLEILPAGEFDPQYRLPLEVASGELPVLPLSIYGAVAMARAPDPVPDGVLAGDEFFVFKFTREQAGLSGLSFDEGTFGVFGYVTKGVELVDQLRSGDVIASARLLEGEDRLVMPSSPA